MKKFLYLISPPKIDKNFFKDLEKVLSSKKVVFFQLRLKNKKAEKIIQLSKKIRKITKKYNVNFIMNDSIKLTLKTKADGCHLGQNDDSVTLAKRKLKKKIIGMTCHNSKKLCKIAKKNKVDYIALGSFFNSKLKPNAVKANIEILKWAKRNINKPIVAIGGINDSNYKKLLKAGANYIALSSFIWNNRFLKPKDTLKKFRNENNSKRN